MRIKRGRNEEIRIIRDKEKPGMTGRRA